MTNLAAIQPAAPEDLTPPIFDAEIETAYAMFVTQHASILPVVSKQDMFTLAYALGYSAAADRLKRQLEAEQTDLLALWRKA